jgi:hypothetical protein
MADIINMSDHRAAVVKPKSEARSYKGHRFTLIFKPNAEVSLRWAWHVKYTRVYEFSGSEATIDKAAKAAQRQIDIMEGRSQRAAV